MKEKTKKYLKDNWIYLVVMIMGFLMLLLQMSQVVMYADDYDLGIISKNEGIKGAFGHFVYNYFNWGGGWTGFLVIIFMMFNIKIWQVFQCFTILAIVIMCTKIVSNKGFSKAITAAIMWMLIFIISVYTTRESVYWLDGGIAYVFTAVQLLLYVYYLYTRITNNTKPKKYDYILLPIVALFAGWSTAQTGFLAIIMPLMMVILCKIIFKQKIPAIYKISIIIALIGYCIFYFAPGNAIRMTHFEEFVGLGFIDKILYKFNSVYDLMFDFTKYPFMGLPFFVFAGIGLLTCVSNSIVKDETKKPLKVILNIFNITNILFILMCIAVSLHLPNADLIHKYCFTYENLYNKMHTEQLLLSYLLPYCIATFVVFSNLFIAITISIKKKDLIIGTLYTGAMISQAMMVMAPVHPYRATFVAIMFLSIMIINLIKMAHEKDIKMSYVLILILSMYNINAGILALLINYVYNFIMHYDDKKNEIAIIITTLFILSAFNYFNVYINYKYNKQIDNENMLRIQLFKEGQGDQAAQGSKIVLKKPADEAYGFTPLLGADWVIDKVKEYFELEPETILIYEEDNIGV